jgi:hypothetical protein
MPGAAFADVYKWVDENGRVHYGERAGSAASERIRVPDSGNSNGQGAGQNRRLEQMRRWLDAREKERQQKNARQAEEQKKMAKRDRQCRRLNSQLIDMERGGIWYKLGDDGERRYYSDEELAAHKARMREAYQQHCS